ncbi:MAG: DUF4349 domain-containing protein [Clostridiales bacterium]|nr:DUF4349 domain-containing protein [Clostridiales bacterium]
MNKHGKLAIILILLFTLCLAAACRAPEPGYDSDYEGGGYYPGEPSDPGNGPPLTAEQTQFEQKLIRNAKMDIQAKDSVALYDALTAYAGGLGGYVHSNDIKHFTAYSVVTAVFKIPPQKLDDFMKFAGDNGEVINSSINTQNITESYYDVQIRLQAKEESLKAYSALLDEAKTINEIMNVQNHIDRITEDIEALKGKLKLWDSQVGMATVTLNIRQENDPTKIKKDINWSALSFSDMGYLIKNGFVGVITILVTIVQYILIAVLVCSIPLIILFGILWLRKKRIRKNRGE